MLYKFENTCWVFKKWDTWKTNAQLSFKELQTLEICGQGWQEAIVKLQKSSSYLMDNMLTWDLPQVITNGSNGKNADGCLHPQFFVEINSHMQDHCSIPNHQPSIAQVILWDVPVNKAEQGSWFFFLVSQCFLLCWTNSRNCRHQFLKYKKTRLVSSSNQHREMSSQQYKAI